MKVICEKCESVFKAEAIKGMSCCPVCGASFDDEVDINEDTIDKKSETTPSKQELEEADKSKMHVNQVHYQDGQMEGFIRIQCKKCLDILYIDIDDAEFIKDDYIKLKNESKVECEKCGYKHTNRYLTYCETVSTAPPLLRCPICNSTTLKKITKGSKFIAAATLGTFALPYNSKTFECKSCGYRF